MDRKNFLGSLAVSTAAFSIFSSCGNNSSQQEGAAVSPFQAIGREDIKITDIRVTPLSYVSEKGPLWGVDSYVVWKADAGLIEIFTDQGIVGIGEGTPYSEPDKIKKYIEENIKPYLIGKNPFDVVSFLKIGRESCKERVCQSV